MYQALLFVFLSFLGLSQGLGTTRTSVACQTHLGSESVPNVISHTETRTIIAPAITIEFASTPIVTVFPLPYSTFLETRTLTLSRTSTVTEVVVGEGAWTTTETRHVTQNITTNHTKTLLSLEQNLITATFTAMVETPANFLFVNATSTTQSETSASSAVETSMSASETLYVMRAGVPVPIMMDGLFSALATASSIKSTIESTAPASEERTESDTAQSTETVTGPDQARAGVITTQIAVSSNGESAAPASIDSQILTEATAAAEPISTLHRRKKRGAISTTTRILGVRGVAASNTMSAAVAFPTRIQCTKRVIRESTFFKIEHANTTTETHTLPTSTTTVVSTLIAYLTVPDRDFSETETTTTTQTITSHVTMTATETTKRLHELTVTSTRTRYAACETGNQMGPRLAGGGHLINVFNRGQEEYSTFDVGYSSNAEDCCMECMLGQACRGSVFEGRRRTCMLLHNGDRETCTNQTAVTAEFVYKTADQRPGRFEFWPDYTVSNGPCGYIRDGGPGE